MLDRAVQHPNRYRLVPTQDDPDVFDLIPEPGEVIEEGTPLNKSTLLQDTTAKQLGLSVSSDPTVDDAFLALYMLIKRGRIVRLHITCNGKAAKAGIPISNATKLDGTPLFTDGTNDLYAIVLGEPLAKLATPTYLDMQSGNITIDTTTKEITDVSWTLPTPAAGTKVFDSSGTFTFRFSPYVTTYDACCVGAGGGGTTGKYYYADSNPGSGGGGGYVANKLNITAVKNEEYTVIVGAGGVGGKNRTSDGDTEAKDGEASFLGLGNTTILNADGGKGGRVSIKNIYNRLTFGGDGNGRGGDGRGDRGLDGPGVAGSVRRFGDPDGVLYSGGAAGGGNITKYPGGAPYGGAGGYYVEKEVTDTDSDGDEYTYKVPEYHKAENGKGPGGGGGGGADLYAEEKNDNLTEAHDGADGFRGEVALRWRISA